MPATVITLLPQQGGIFSGPNLVALNAGLAVQNANNVVVDAAITALQSGSLAAGAASLTAHAGGTQAAALALASGVNSVDTVGTIADSVKLPASVAGGFCIVINDAALSLQIFGASTDTIDDVATATGISMPGKSTLLFGCPVAGKWYSSKSSFLGLQAITASGAVLPRVGATYVVTKAGVAVLTLAAPTATADDGLILQIISSTANAHTLTATGLFGTGAAAVNLATFAAFAGAGVTLMAYQAKWLVVSSVGITFS